MTVYITNQATGSSWSETYSTLREANARVNDFRSHPELTAEVI